LATCSKYSQVRFYDRREKSLRPFTKRGYGDYSYNCITGSKNNELEVFVGDVIGKCFKLNVTDKSKHKIVVYKGGGGSVRCIAEHPTLDYVATCSADRFVRVFDITKRSLQHKNYLIQRQNCILFTKDDVEKNSDDENSEDENEEEEKVNDNENNEDNEENDENNEDENDEEDFEDEIDFEDENDEDEEDDEDDEEDEEESEDEDEDAWKTMKKLEKKKKEVKIKKIPVKKKQLQKKRKPETNNQKQKKQKRN
jgi:hypothetical protein